MKRDELERLTRKYYGYVADLEGSGVEVLDLLCVRDSIQAILEQSTPERRISQPAYKQIHDLDQLLWEERTTFLMVVGEQELQFAREQRRSPRSHWWWYLDELNAPPPALREQLAQAFEPL